MAASPCSEFACDRSQYGPMAQNVSGRVRAVNVDGVVHHVRQAAGMQLRPHWPYFAGKSRKLLSWEGSMYQAPKLERLGSFREVTLAGGDFNPGDGGNPYHRYAPL